MRSGQGGGSKILERGRPMQIDFRIQSPVAQQGVLARAEAQGIKNWIGETDSSKLLLLEHLNYTCIVAISVLAVYDAIKAFAVLR